MAIVGNNDDVVLVVDLLSFSFRHTMDNLHLYTHKQI